MSIISGVCRHLETARMDVITGRTRKVGAAHLVLAGTIDVILGLIVLQHVVSGTIERALLTVIPPVVSDATLLRHGELFASATVTGTLLSSVVVLLGSIQVVGGIGAYHGQNHRFVRACSAVSIVIVPTLPLSVIALVLLTLAAETFDT